MTPSALTEFPAIVEAIRDRLKEPVLPEVDIPEVASLIAEFENLQTLGCIVLAYADGEISESRSAELLGVTIQQLREIKIAALDMAVAIAEATPHDLSRLPLEDQLKLVAEMTSEWLTMAAEDTSQFEGDGIIWADLSVTDCCYSVSLSGDKEFVVTISEVSPDATRLREYLFDRVQDCDLLTGHDVRFVFEW